MAVYVGIGSMYGGAHLALEGNCDANILFVLTTVDIQHNAIQIHRELRMQKQ